MARINYPELFLKLIELFKKIKAKHDADGAGSVLNPYLTEQGINLAADLVKVNSAKDKNKLFENAEKDAEDYTQDRNKLFDSVFDNMTGGFQFLKKLYRGNPAELGHWGATVNGNAIVYPPEFIKRVDLFTDYKAKHDTYPGDTSPLAPYLTVNDIDMDDDETDVATAEDEHKSAKQTEKDAEDLREERDNFFNPVMEHVRGMGQYLKGLYVKHSKHLGKWGYVIDDSPRDPKFRTVTINGGDTKIISQIKVGSQMENTGEAELQLYKGEDTTATPHNLAPEMRFTIKRGWGTTTVVNPDPATDGEIGYLTTNQ